MSAAGRPVRVIGVDPGSLSTGWAILEVRGRRPWVVAWGSIRPDPKERFAGRLASIKEALDEVVLRYRPTEAAVEDLFHAASARTAIRLGEVRGVVVVALAEAGLPVHGYAPAKVKKAVSGFGGAGKDQVGRMVSKLLGLREVPKPADAADALAIALCHLHDAGLASAQAPASRARGIRHPVRG